MASSNKPGVSRRRPSEEDVISISSGDDLGVPEPPQASAIARHGSSVKRAPVPQANKREPLQRAKPCEVPSENPSKPGKRLRVNVAQVEARPGSSTAKDRAKRVPEERDAPNDRNEALQEALVAVSGARATLQRELDTAHATSDELLQQLASMTQERDSLQLIVAEGHKHRVEKQETQRLQDEVRRLQEEVQRLQEEVQRLQGDARRREGTVAAAKGLVDALQSDSTCTICTCRLWLPYALPCGHTACQACLREWFSEALMQHLHHNPQLEWPNLQPYRDAIRNPEVPRADRERAKAELANVLAAYPTPRYTCPICRQPVQTRPTEDVTLRSVVWAVADALGEENPAKSNRETHGGNTIWDGFFLPTADDLELE
ncbi:uncharacterized protein B0H18DRAFT_1116089 [Fomitopsis serialis]|uniref:uncharacterized protein n=1 Tax=Fomitopsis serialis TaxID=139415 RepID=UPI0020088D47|nr:uncharacterized protein B0H18DRAFT_1116089 [Neoantrodia serialis]KAH9931836.1 hypothetical protein B0H18DRAFT_1116089 [Neoantrodia serialis]